MPKNNKVTLKDVYELIKELRLEVNKTYVAKTEFEPVKMIAYGLAGMILIGVVGAVITLVVRTTVIAFF